MSDKKINYKALDQRSHVLHRPDMYIGSVKGARSEEYVYDKTTQKISKKSISTNHGLVRIFVEAISNAIDNVWRSSEHKVACTKIRVCIDKQTGKTSVWNDGLTIPVELDESGIYIPDMIFGKLLTSSNYEDSEERKTSGRNGVGITCTNIFSKEFTVDIKDTKTNKRYTQVWTDNMEKKDTPKIRQLTEQKTGYTEVSWIPDFVRFGLSGYTDDILGVLYKYVVDTAMITGVAVYLDDERVSVKTIREYAKLYYDTLEMAYISTRECEVVFSATNESEYSSISFVNGIETRQGGVHVDPWSDAILRALLEKINNKKKDQPQINIREIRQFFRIFVKATLVNPEFTSQEKTKLSAPAVKVAVDQKTINQIMKWKTIDKIYEIIKGKELVSLKKLEKKKGFKKIEGLDPANNAGTSRSEECSLILCEGLSAKTFAVLGIDVGVYNKKGRDWHGILALRGKCLNVRNATPANISKNREIMNIIQALGIRHGVDYTRDDNFKTLNYGRVILLCDSDVDGYHITGLILNMFHYLFPSVMERKYIVMMKTPLIRIYLKNSELAFYSMEAFKRYAQQNPDYKGRVKYFKGLGTSSDKEIRSSFGKKVVEFDKGPDTDQTMIKAFHQKNTDARKQWIGEYDPSLQVEEGGDEKDSAYEIMDISDFIDYELIKFSIDDCKRSIPNIMDGLKESQRKILYATILKGLKHSSKTIKVAQLAGFVSEKTNYHHGEQCLFDTIIKMAQDFVGSNNIPLLYRDGQFGSRLSNGKDAASARYIYTKLDKWTRLVFKEEDDVLLQAQIDDGDPVEPVYYVPILPMVLVNGSEGIGTGWSSSIPCYNPKDIISCIRCWIEKKPYPEMIPWYNGFEGVIQKCGEYKYETYGAISEDGAKTWVEELPIGMSTDSFKDFVEELIEEKKLKSYKNYSTPTTVKFQLVESNDGIKCNYKTLKLKTQINTSNMVLFDSKLRIKKYDSVHDIITEFCEVRYEYYVKRKQYLISEYSRELDILENKYRFINEIMDDILVIHRRDELDIATELKERKYTCVNSSEDEEESVAKGYRYLLDMKINQFTNRRLQQLADQIAKLKNTLESVSSTSEIDMWNRDLEEFENSYY